MKKQYFPSGVLCLLFILFLSSCDSTKKSQKTKAEPISSPANVVIYTNAGEKYGPCEPSIAISKENPQNIIAGSILDFVHSSSNGGSSWTTKKLNSSLGVFGDPCIISDYDGNFYYFHLGDPTLKGWQGDKILESIVVQKTASNGIIWNDGAEIGKNPPKQQDKEWAAVNRDNDLAVCWTEFDKYGDESEDCHSRILFSRSTDQAESWSKPVQISEFEGNCKDGDMTTEGSVPSYGKDNQIYTAYAYDEKIFFDKSMNDGETWLDTDIVAASHSGGWAFSIEGIGRANGMPVTAVDKSSGANEGRVYINYATGGEDPNIYLIWSDDEGNTWSEPKKVNKSSDKSDQFFPWMSVDPMDGQIYIVYYDKYGLDNNKFHTTLAYSNDGGETFEEVRISKKASLPPNDSEFFGDYNNIDARNGIIRPIWTSYDGEKMSVLTALINR